MIAEVLHTLRLEPPERVFNPPYGEASNTHGRPVPTVWEMSP
jgi:hypothetical protein